MSRNGLTREPVSGEMTAHHGADGIKVEFWEGGFLSLKTHTFAVGQEYRLEIDDGKFWDIDITGVEPGLVRFQTR